MQRAQIAPRDHFALADEHDFVAGNLDFAEQVRIQEDGRAAVALRADDVTHQAAAHGIESRSRFIEEDQLGLVDQRLSEADALQHALWRNC